MFSSRKNRSTCLVVLAALGTIGANAFAQGDPRALVIKSIHRRPSFMVRVAVDRSTRTYAEGDSVVVRVKSEQSGYLYLFYCDADKHAYCVFPNRFQADNKIARGAVTTVPAPDASFGLEVKLPFGREVLTALVTPEPLTHSELKKTSDNIATAVSFGTLSEILAQNLRKQGVGQHHVEILTYDRQDPPREVLNLQRGLHRRVALCVGISQYRDERITRLRVTDQNARRLAAVLKTKCGFDRVDLLINKDATLQNVRDTILGRLVKETRPGDTVVLYWSGHGSYCDDDNEDEDDGRDEYLIPYDGVFQIDQLRSTMLIDDTFGRWLQALDGRKVVVILDTCHAGGQARGPNLDAPWDFLDSEMDRAREIGQRQTVLLASCKASEQSLQRVEKDLGVMTYFLVERLETGDDTLTTSDVFDHLKQVVPAYVRKTYRSRYTQTPTLVPAGDQTVIRPPAR